VQTDTHNDAFIMITIISGTGRKGSRTLQVAQHYHQLLASKGVETTLLSLERLTSLQADADFRQIENDILIPTQKYLIITPEYNGTFPGIFKLMVDISDIKKAWWHKKAALAGVSDGRAGNLRGMDHLTNALNYLKMDIMPNKLPLSQIGRLMDADGRIHDEGALNAIGQQVEDFIRF
jgi:chromate reductase, NAD(P)H dehydrogenase (quinone)